MNKKAETNLGIVLLLMALIAGYYFFIMENGIHNPFNMNNNIVCGNKICQGNNEIDESISCPSDCGIICGDKECITKPYDERIYCPQDCGLDNNDVNNKIAIIYVYKNNINNNNYNKLKEIIPNIKYKFNLLTNKNIDFDVIQNKFKINFNYPNDLNDAGWYELKEIMKELKGNSEFIRLYNQYSGVIIVLEGTKNSAFSVDYKTPILINTEMLYSNDLVIIFIHEILHTYGLEDFCSSCSAGIPSGCEKDIMALLINPNNYLCSQSLSNLNNEIGKTDLSEYV